MSWDCKQFDYLNGVTLTEMVRMPRKPSYLSSMAIAHAGEIDPSAKAVANKCDEIAANTWPHEQPVGIEVELEDVGLQAVDDHIYRPYEFFWSKKEDGSLRNKGAEFVSHVGVSVENAPIALDALETYIAAATNGRAHANARTGLHIHYNVGGKQLRELCNALFLYAVLEPVFFEVSGKRSESIFCVPWHANRRSLGEVINNVVNTTHQGIFSKVWRWRNYSKYCALNLAPIAAFGTVEFRMHAGTYDPIHIYRWISAIHNLFRHAYATDIADNYQAFRSKRTPDKYLSLIRSIFGEYYIPPCRIHDLVQECVEATIVTLKGFIDYGHLPEEEYKLPFNNVVQPRLNRGFEVRNILRHDDEDFDIPDEPYDEDDGNGEEPMFLRPDQDDLVARLAQADIVFNNWGNGNLARGHNPDDDVVPAQPQERLF